VAAALLLAAVPEADAQAVRLYVLADSVSLGERFEIAVAVDHPPGRSVVFPPVPAGDPEAGPLLSLGQAEAFSMRRLPPVARGAVRTDSAVYDVAVFAVDTARVGPVPIRLATGRDTVRLRSAAAQVPVRSELTNEEAPEPAPLGPPEPFPSAVLLWVLVGLLALAGLALLAWALRRAFRRRPAAAPRLAPYPEAVQALDALDAAPHTPGTVEAHLVDVRTVLRTYLSRRLGLPALAETTAELTTHLATDERATPQSREAVLDVLHQTDLVAFAGLRPDAPTTAALRARTREAVDAIEAAVQARERAAAAPHATAPDPA
jgi:hypothetical protein